MTRIQQAKTQSGGQAAPSERDIFAGLAFCWGDMVLTVDQELNIRFARGATAHYTGLAPEALQGRVLTEFVADADAPRLGDIFAASQSQGRVQREPVHLITDTGACVAVRLSGYVDPDAPTSFFMALRKISAKEKLEAGQVRCDRVTGLLEADAFAAVAAEELHESATTDTPPTVTLVDLPGFERIASGLGPARRATLSRRLAEVIRTHAVAGRLATQVGDGRFSLVADANADVSELESQIGELVRRADPAGRGTRVRHTSIAADGAAELDEADVVRGVKYMLNNFGHDDGSGLQLADLANNMGELVDRAVREVGDFKRIVADGAFNMVFQPIVHATNGRVHHYEALCRFRHAHGEPEPGRRIAFAEETGVIHELDLAMVRQAIAWLARRPRHDTETRVAVNVSGQSVETEAYTEELLTLLDAAPWTRERLLFEITESARMGDLRAANRFLRALRERGYTVCLDDLGAGAASFRYLSALEVDMVKIDGSAIRHARAGAKGRAFLSALTELCHRLGTATVAEMVDDEQALRFVRDCGVTYVQGYLFGQPSANLRDFSPLSSATLFQRHRELV